MAEHGHGAHGHEASHGGGHEGKGEKSVIETMPVVGRAISMLKEIVSPEGLKKFLFKMSDEHITPVALKVFDWIGIFFGASGGGGGGGHSHAHAH